MQWRTCKQPLTYRIYTSKQKKTNEERQAKKKELERATLLGRALGPPPVALHASAATDKLTINMDPADEFGEVIRTIPCFLNYCNKTSSTEHKEAALTMALHEVSSRLWLVELLSGIVEDLSIALASLSTSVGPASHQPHSWPASHQPAPQSANP